MTQDPSPHDGSNAETIRVIEAGEHSVVGYGCGQVAALLEYEIGIAEDLLSRLRKVPDRPQAEPPWRN